MKKDIDYHMRKDCNVEPASIYEILGLSNQATDIEIDKAYKAECEYLAQLNPVATEEVDLLEFKKKQLTDAYNNYKSTPHDIITSLDESYKKMNEGKTERLYGFNIPCVLWLVMQVLNCGWNSCFAGCSCLNPCGASNGGCGEEDCCMSCYNGSDLLKGADTVIAIVAVIAAAVAAIKRIGGALETRNAVARERAREQAYQDFCGKVESTYNRWKKISSYDSKNIMTFLHTIDTIKVETKIDDEFSNMILHMESLASDLKRQRLNIEHDIANLRADENYSRLIKDFPSKYSNMFSNKSSNRS